MEQIKWCLSKKNGIEIVDPNENLRGAYILKAEEALEALRETTVRDWKLSAAYYSMYHGIYSLLMKIGVKCEIHTCTIEFAKRFLNTHFTADDLALLEKAFRARNDAQYYVDREVADEDYQLIIKKAPAFLVKCKDTIIDQKEATEIREKIKSLSPKH